MPKRKTADVNVEQAPVTEPKKRSAASKPKTAAAATHKRTPRKAMAEPATVLSEIPVESPVEFPTTTAAVAAPARLSYEEIAFRAYLYAESRGFQGGSPEDDWFRAERDLLELAQNR